MRYTVERDFEHAGLRCVVIITEMGHRCGYVGVPEDRLFYGVGYTLPALYFDVHGGITYAGGGKGSKYPVESDLWWFGYDCNHLGDGKDLSVVSDALREIEIRFPTYGVIRTVEYCIDECKSLAEQMADI